MQRILADREVRATLAALTDAGSRVRYAAADVRNASQLGVLLDSVRAEFGPITGLVHGAGVLADAPLHKKTLEGFDRVFETKVGGLCVLLDATAADPLKLVCLFSSVAEVGVSRRFEAASASVSRRRPRSSIGPRRAIIRTAAHSAKRRTRASSFVSAQLSEVLLSAWRRRSAGWSFRRPTCRCAWSRHLQRHFERAIVVASSSTTAWCRSSRARPRLVEHVELQEPTPLFEAYGVEEAIEGVLSRRVDLPSGGYLMIDYAEALTVIDVNSGSFIGRGKGAALEDTITKTNLEAAEEVVNQLRLRDIGGIIVIDFIDMARARNRDAVMKVLRKSLDEDRTKTSRPRSAAWAWWR